MAGETAVESASGNIFSTYSLEQLRRRTSEKWRFYAPDVLPLWVAEMDVPLVASVREEIDRLIDLGDTGYDSSEDGRRYLEAYRGFAKRRWNADIDVEHGRTAVDVISGIRAVIVKTLGERPLRADAAVAADGANDAGEKALYEGNVVVQTPIYPPFLHRLPQNYTLVKSPLNAECHTDFENLESAFARLERNAPEQKPESGYNTVFVLCSPHNPTGTVFDADELNRIVNLCKQYHVRLVADEIHSPIVVDTAESRKFVPILSLPAASSAIVSVSASKGFSLPGFKAALLIPGADAEAVETVSALTQEEVHTGAHVASNVHAAAFERGDEWLDRMVAGLAENEQLFRKQVAAELPKANVVLGQGTYLAFVDLGAYFTGTQWDGKASEALLEKARVAFNDGATFGGASCGNYVRVNLATNPDIITEAVHRVAKFIQNL